MIGNEIAHNLHGKVIKHQNAHTKATLTCSVFFGNYHDYYGEPADIALSNTPLQFTIP